MDKKSDPMPSLPRRSFVVAGLSAVLAGSIVALSVLGNLSEIDKETFGFSRGTSFATGDEQRLRAFLARALQDDRIDVVILGHSGTAGETSANMKLSEARAEMTRTIALEFGVSPAQVSSTGLGGFAPLDKLDGESERAFQARLARVEVSLQMRR